MLSGGNIDPLLLAKVLRHGLTAAGRYLDSGAGCRTGRGAGHAAARSWPRWGPTSWSIVHERVAPQLHVDEAEVLLQVETRDRFTARK